MRNVVGRENLITCGRTNELAHAVRTEYSCDSFMADRMGLDGTMLHYLAVRKAIVGVHKPVPLCEIVSHKHNSMSILQSMMLKLTSNCSLHNSSVNLM